ncbi:hypothetical protein BDR22DRAFT_281509 [Usnea florida]
MFLGCSVMREWGGDHPGLLGIWSCVIKQMGFTCLGVYEKLRLVEILFLGELSQLLSCINISDSTAVWYSDQLQALPEATSIVYRCRSSDGPPSMLLLKKEGPLYLFFLSVNVPLDFLLLRVNVPLHPVSQNVNSQTQFLQHEDMANMPHLVLVGTSQVDSHVANLSFDGCHLVEESFGERARDMGLVMGDVIVKTAVTFFELL